MHSERAIASRRHGNRTGLWFSRSGNPTDPVVGDKRPADKTPNRTQPRCFFDRQPRVSSGRFRNAESLVRSRIRRRKDDRRE